MNKKSTLFVLLTLAVGAISAQYRFAGRVLGVSREYNAYPQSWSAAQALGEPNVYPQYRDIDGAWAAEDYGDQRDTLILGFDNNSPIDSILIWETCGAGIVDTVYIKNPITNKWVLVFGRKGQNYPSAADTLARILRIGFPMTSFNVSEVRIELANDSSTEWSEIDAVAIHPQTLTPTTYSNLPGNAAQFDGVDDYYRTNFSSWNLNNKDEFTLMAWVKVTADSAPNVSGPYGGASIIHDAYYAYLGLTLSDLGGGDSIYAFVNAEDYGYIGLPMNKGVWQHIAMVNSKSELKLYLNGELYGTTVGSTFDSTDAYGLLEFGRNFDAEYFFKGELDEVKAYNRMLTAAEVLKQKYTIGEGAINANLVGYWQFNQTDSFHWNKYTHRTDSIHNGGGFVQTGTLLSVKNPNPIEMGIYPNPNNGNFGITLQNKFTGNLNISVLNIHGSKVYEQVADFQNGLAQLNLSQLPSGIYLLNMGNENLRFIKE